MIYTLGYTGISLPQVQRFLEKRQALLVDIRYRPTSHNPTWRREALQRTLGARYVHLGALGNRNYKGGPIAIVDIEEGTAQVRALLQHAAAWCSSACVRTCTAVTARVWRKPSVRRWAVRSHTSSWHHSRSSFPCGDHWSPRHAVTLCASRWSQHTGSAVPPAPTPGSGAAKPLRQATAPGTGTARDDGLTGCAGTAR